MAVNTGELDVVLFDHATLSIPDATGLQTPRWRNRIVTLLVIEEFQRRYPPGVPPDLFAAVVNDLIGPAAPDPITMGAIRGTIDHREVTLGLQPTNRLPPAPANNVEAFLRLLERRRGAYRWNRGSTATFGDWTAPAGPAIADGATINCWEVLLYAAQQANLVTRAALAAAYALPIHDRQAAVHRLIAAHGDHVLDLGNPANNVQLGDIVMLGMGTDVLHHVVAVAQPDLADFGGIEVYSLWDGRGGGCLSRTLLDDVRVPGTTEIRYASL
jgi:hypothetical protein